MNASEIIEQPAHTGSLDVKCKEKLEIAGSFHLVDEAFNDSSIFFGPKCPSVNSGMGSLADPPSRERNAQRISNRRKKNKGKPTKMFYYKAISETRNGRCDQDDIVASYQPSKEERGIGSFNSDRNSKSCPSSAVLSSLSASGYMGKFSKDSSAFNERKLFECSYNEISDLSRSRLLSDVLNNHNCKSSNCCKGLNRCKQGPEELTSNPCAGDLKENLFYKQSSQCKSCSTIDILSCGVEDCSNCIYENTEINGKCSTATNFHAVAPGDDFKSSTLTSQCEAVHKRGHYPFFFNGKEKCHFTWQKSLKNVWEARNYGEKKLNPFHTRMDASLRQKNLCLKCNSSSTERWSPSLLVSSSVHNNAADGIKEKFKDRKVQGNVLVEPSCFVAHQRLTDSLYPHVSRSSQVSTRPNWEFENFHRKANHSVKHMNFNNCKKGLGYFDVNLLRLRNKQFFSQKEPLQVPLEWNNRKNCYAAQGAIHNSYNVMTGRSHSLHTSIASSAHLYRRAKCSTKSRVMDQGVLNWIPPPYTWMKNPRMEHVIGRSLLASVECERMNFARCGLPYENIPRDVNSRIIQRNPPVLKKEPGMMEDTGSVGVYNDHNVSSSFSTKVENINYPKEKNVLVTSSLSAAEDISLISSHKVTSVKREVPQFESVGTEIKAQKVESAKDSVAYGNEPKDALTLLSDPHTLALNTAYRLQLASESVELASGWPLAEFERFLHSATPVIAPFLYEKCDICLDNQLFHSSLCKHQRPNLSLCAVWNWYQKPGSYGLEVKAESENSKGLFTDPIPHYAYFVPFLSAVQLFHYTSISNCRNTCLINPKMKYKEVGLQSSSSETLDISPSEAIKENHFQDDKMVNFDSVDGFENSLRVSRCNGNDSLSLISIPSFSDDAELIFEYFESEQPQQRKPLFNKIVDLVNDETSSHQPFGNSSMLNCMMLRDLHPASWFSVAWYPIYRIPESSFRASFLTYHSLGYLVQKCIPADSLSDHIFYVVCPVLGLQSYNTQGEVWFDPKMPVESSAEESNTFKHSEILKDRLRMLEENALLFSRGCVCKDHVKVANRHPDYEFFTSRKR